MFTIRKMKSRELISVKGHFKTLIPILKSGEVESNYALRLTPQGKYGVDEVTEFCRTFSDYIFVEELSKKKIVHYHVVLFTSDFEDVVREKVRIFLSYYFTEPPRRGDANKQYNLSEINDLDLAITYILKDEGIINVSSNIDMDELDKLKKKSYKKYSKDDFAKALEELKVKFKEDSSSIGDMMESIVLLKSVYRQPVNMNQIYQMCISYDVHNNRNKASFYVQEFLSRYN